LFDIEFASKGVGHCIYFNTEARRRRGFKYFPGEAARKTDGSA